MSPEGRRGTLVLVVGPSGVGKDSLISYCRDRLAGSPVVFPRRSITRPADSGSEDHVELSPAEFEHLAAAGGFALHWRAHGLSYGIPAGIATDLAQGRSVVCNVSRTMLDEARRRFSPVRVASVSASPQEIAARLNGRGREAPEAIAARIARAVSNEVAGADVVQIDNSGPLGDAGERLRELIVGTLR